MSIRVTINTCECQDTVVEDCVCDILDDIKEVFEDIDSNCISYSKSFTVKNIFTNI